MYLVYYFTHQMLIYSLYNCYTTDMTNKTVVTKQSVSQFINSIEDSQLKKDSKTVAKIMHTISGKKPTMWGPSIVGYGTYHYRYDSGREGDFLRIGFSPRKSGLSIYLMPGYQDLEKELAQLGRHKAGKSCLNIKQLSDVDMATLEDIIKKGWDVMQKMYPE